VFIPRRQFLGLGAALWQKLTPPPKIEEATVGAASEDVTPRVGIVLSSFAGGEEHDGSKLKGLARPRPVDADLDDAGIDALVRKAIELGNTRKGGLPALVAADDWVVVKTHIPSCYGPGGTYIAGDVTDPRVVRSLVAFLAENKLGARITIAEGSPEWQPREKSKSAADGWSTDWGGAFGGLTYRKMIEDFTRRYPRVRYEIVDLNFDEAIELPVQGKPLAKRNPQGVYKIPKTIQQCDKLISVAPLKVHPRMGVSLAVGNYLGIAPGAEYGFPKSGLDKLGDPDEVAVDLFSFHPADYAMLGGGWGVEIDETGARRSVHHNLIVAGPKAVAVDAAGAAIMGFDPARIGHLRLAEQNGFGDYTVDIIWIRGNEIDQARRPFRRGAWKERV
jgi:hypothetical protein